MGGSMRSVGLLVACVLVTFAAGCAEEEEVGSCTDRLRNGGESDVDCGGRCSPCQDGLFCVVADDCRSGVCDEDGSGRCVPASCSDGLQNGDESDVDCGGLGCEPCEGGLACTRGADCVSRSCASGVCADSTCTDGRRNGTESDVDCGGDACGKCPPASDCRSGDDCDSLLCLGGRCAESSCTDGLANGDEPDVDCGGSSCRPCLSGQACDVAADCEEGVCTGNRCMASTCSDGVLNGRESDVDCGRTCTPCPDAATCRSQPDCLSGVCDLATDTCAAPACDDDTFNGGETDVDCGGGICRGCDPGQRCGVDADCLDKICLEDGTCKEPACDDLVQNGAETDVDCGGDACAPCDPGLACALGRDCTSRVCDATTSTCAEPACTDGVENGSETDVDCGGVDCDGCANFLSCDTGDDCLSGTCSSGFCVPTGASVFGTSASYIGITSVPTELPCPDASTGTGTEITTLTDFNPATVDFPFDFEFFGEVYSSAEVQLNGVLTFDAAFLTYSSSFNSCGLYSTTSLPDIFIAPYWDDLEALSGDVYYETFGAAPNRTFVVQWELPHDFSTGDYDIRLALHEGSNQIDVCYAATTSTSTFYTEGANATASLNNGETRENLQYSCNTRSLTNGRVLSYVPR